jgi:hypothetical protein
MGLMDSQGTTIWGTWQLTLNSETNAPRRRMAMSSTSRSSALDTRYGLDGEAVKAAKKWLFAPGMKDGVPVNVRVTMN